MKLVFMGTPDFAVPSLQAMHDAGHEIVGVFTQPDRPSGRGNKITASPIKLLATRLGLPVYQPAKIKSEEAVALLKKLQPECMIVVAFGQILSNEILQIPRYGCINVHASLLPAYRGAAPIHWAVINGETETGVTTMLMDQGLDTGDMLLTQAYTIQPEATTGQVHDALAKIGADLLMETINGFEQGTIQPRPQPQTFTYAPLLKREHEKIDWARPATVIHNQIRGLNPWPGAFTLFQQEQVKVWESKINADTTVMRSLFNQTNQTNQTDETQDQQNATASSVQADQASPRPGQIIAISEDGLVVATAEGTLEITMVQPAGKKKMSAHDFFNGRCIQLGDSFTG